MTTTLGRFSVLCLALAGALAFAAEPKEVEAVGEAAIVGDKAQARDKAIEDALRFHKANKLSPHLEIETYTWDVLPEHLKTGDIVDYVEMELNWVRDQLIGA